LRFSKGERLQRHAMALRIPGGLLRN